MPNVHTRMCYAAFALMSLVVVSCTAQEASSVDKSSLTERESGDVEWSRFRGPTGMGITDSQALPVRWSPSESIRWKKRLPGAGSSSPIVSRGRIYLTCYSGYGVPGSSEGSVDDLTRHVLCVTPDDGSIIWDKTFPARQPEEERIRDHGYAANTLAADGERIYAFLGSAGVFALDYDGNQIWQANVGTGTHGWGTAASPVLYEDMVIINASVESKSLIALDRATGEERWNAPGINESWNTPVIVQSPQGTDELVVARLGNVLGFDPQTGKQLWSCETDITWYMVPSGVAADGVVYFLGGRSGTAALAVRTGGRGDVTATHRLWTSQKGSNVTSPVYRDGHLYWVHEKLSIAYCAVAESGELVYEKRLNRGGQFYASSLLTNDHVYHLNRSGRTFVVTAKPDFELVSTNDLSDGSLFNASPAVMGDNLLIRSDKFLYCIGD